VYRYTLLTIRSAVLRHIGYRVLQVNIIGGRITETITWVMLSMIWLSLSRDEFRTISVSKCPSHLAQLICVVCFLAWSLFEVFLGGNE